jgi:N-acetylneuraminic acid mutarotase
LDDLEAGWEVLPSLPAPGRAFSVLVAQTRADRECLYLIGGRLEASSGEVSFLAEVFEFDPKQKSKPWKGRASLPVSLSAGTGVALGENHIFMLSGADGSLMSVADELKLDHPGFPKSIFAYDTNADSWSEAGKLPVNQVTTQAVAWKDSVFLVTGEVKPRVRTKQGWEISLSPSASKKAN